MKDDTISRAAALKGLEDLNIASFYEENEHSKEAYTEVKAMLKALQSAQPEIIHCKDCKFYGRADKRRFYRGSDCLNKRIDTIVPDRDFCSRAERRGEA